MNNILTINRQGLGQISLNFGNREVTSKELLENVNLLSNPNVNPQNVVAYKKKRVPTKYTFFYEEHFFSA